MHQFSLRAARSKNALLILSRWPCGTRYDSRWTRDLSVSFSRSQDNRNKAAQTEIRWFQKAQPNSPEEPYDPENDDGDEAAELKKRIEEMEAELRELRGEGERPILEPLLEELGLSEEERQRFRDLVKKQRAEDKRDSHLSDDTIQPSATTKPDVESPARYVPNQDSLKIEMDLPKDQHLYLQRLNKSLLQAAMDIPDDRGRRNLWRWYMLCKRNLPPFFHLIPEEAWEVLCKSQYNSPEHTLNRGANLKTLVGDMMKNEKCMTPGQMLAYIESLHAEGRHKEAIDQWRSQQKSFSVDEPMTREYETLGVRLFAAIQDPKMAENIARDLLGKDDRESARILIPIIEAWVRSGTDKGLKRAFTLYLRLKAQLGSSITLDDYDMVSMCFMKHGRADLALAVFKDLMLENDPLESRKFYNSSAGVMTDLQSRSIDMSELNKVSLTALTVLPRRFQNKYFFASWIKKLLGMGETASAASVVELMFERGIKPDAKHLNGIIGAWLRNGSTKDKERAEQMGWAMIQERLAFVYKRRGEEYGQITALEKPADIQLPRHLQRTVSRATIETFSLLVLYYGRRGMFENVQLLRDYLSVAEIPPNSYFINHILYAELHRGNHQAVYKINKEMFRTAKRDLETFACLWDCEKAHLDALTIHQHDSFPNPRQIFSDMISWFSTLTPRERNSAVEDFSRDLYEQIIRCFCLSKDLPGTIVALYALRDNFSIHPDPQTTRMISLQVAHMGAHGPKSTDRRRKRQRSARQSVQSNMLNVKTVMDLLAMQRGEDLLERGIFSTDADEEMERNEQLFMLAEFIRAVLRRTAPEPADVEHAVKDAARIMGVGKINVADHLLSDNGSYNHALDSELSEALEAPKP